MLKPKDTRLPAEDKKKSVNTSFKIDAIVAPANMKIEPVSSKEPKAVPTPPFQRSKINEPVVANTASAAKTSLGPVKLAGLAVGLIAVVGVLFLMLPSQTAEPETVANAISTPIIEDVVPVMAAAAAVAPTVVSAESDFVSQITSGTLAALRGKPETKTVAAPAVSSEAPAAASALYSMVLNAVIQGQSEGYIDQMLNEAHVAQTINVPTALIGADGRVDTATILAAFVAK
jgi:hypothetical protein